MLDASLLHYHARRRREKLSGSLLGLEELSYVAKIHKKKVK